MVTQSFTNKLQVFVHKCLRKILNIYWAKGVFDKMLEPTWKPLKFKPKESQNGFGLYEN